MRIDGEAMALMFEGPQIWCGCRPRDRQHQCRQHANWLARSELAPVFGGSLAAAWPSALAPESFHQVKDHCPDGHALVMVMIAEPSVATFKPVLSRQHPAGTVTFEQPTADARGEVPPYELTWNHTTLQVLKRDRGVTYLQALHPAARLLDSVAEIGALFAEELYSASGIPAGWRPGHGERLPILRFTSEDRLNEIIAEHRSRGVSIADTHVFPLEDGVARSGSMPTSWHSSVRPIRRDC
jgi:hypothetical protein